MSELYKAGNGTSSRATFSQINWILWAVLPPVLMVFGSFGNVMTILVMLRMRRVSSTACLSLYFTALAVSDELLLLSTLFKRWLEAAWDVPFSHLHDLTCRIPDFLSYTSSMTSAWFLVAMTCQRMTSVMMPHRVGAVCTVRKGKMIITMIVIFCVAVNVQFLFTYTLVPAGNSSTGYLCHFITSQSFEYFMLEVHPWIDLTLSSLSPFLVLIIANAFLIHRTLRSLKLSRQMRTNKSTPATSREKKVSSMTVTLILTSLAFLVLTSPICIYQVYVDALDFPDSSLFDDSFPAQHVALAFSVTMLLWCSNSAINFFLYCVSGSKFRREARQWLCPQNRNKRSAVWTLSQTTDT